MLSSLGQASYVVDTNQFIGILIGEHLDQMAAAHDVISQIALSNFLYGHTQWLNKRSICEDS
jgi:hypothetical protein